MRVRAGEICLFDELRYLAVCVVGEPGGGAAVDEEGGHEVVKVCFLFGAVEPDLVHSRQHKSLRQFQRTLQVQQAHQQLHCRFDVGGGVSAVVD